MPVLQELLLPSSLCSKCFERPKHQSSLCRRSIFGVVAVALTKYFLLWSLDPSGQDFSVFLIASKRCWLTSVWRYQQKENRIQNMPCIKHGMSCPRQKENTYRPECEPMAFSGRSEELEVDEPLLYYQCGAIMLVIIEAPTVFQSAGLALEGLWPASRRKGFKRIR